jgi:hypothetical protein
MWLFSPDKQLFFFASLLLLYLIKLSWRDNEPKIAFLGVLSYWLTVCTLLIYGVFFNVKMIDLTKTPETFIYTTYLAMIATFFYCSGLFYTIRNVKTVSVSVLYNELKRYDGRKLLLFYSAYSIFSSLFTKVVLTLGGLSQLGIGIIWCKWAFLTILIIHTLLFHSNQKWVNLVLILEVVLSFSGFWSSFKDYLFIGAAGFLTFSETISPKRVLQVAVLGCAAFVLMVMWSVVKGDYRNYLTGGKRSQVVQQQGTFDNLQRLGALVSESFSGENFNANFRKGIENLANRISYTEYFAMSVKQVPEFLPFEKGELLMGGLEHVLKPRLFFPGKKTIDDSEMTSRYTGRTFSGAEFGSSFSLGSVAERYIDYGPVYMFIPIFFFGVLLGNIYKYIIRHSLNHVWGLAFVAPLFFLIPSLGIATTKFLGWVLTYFIVWFAINKYAMKRIDAFLKIKVE